LAAILAAATPAAAQTDAAPDTGDAAAPRSVSEQRLPEYQAEAMAEDLPARDVLLTPDGTVWAAGKRDLWQWAPATGKLKRWPLHEKTKDPTRLMRLGTDGTSVFAASWKTLYQLQLAQKRIFRFGLGGDGKMPTYGFAGTGEDFWLVHAAALVRFDRYGKRLDPRYPAPPIQPKDKPLLEPARKLLWLMRGSDLLKVDLDATPPTTKTVLHAKHKLLDVQRVRGGLVVHTAYTVLALDDSGKLTQSVPVEGRHRLRRMAVTDDEHAYLFDDRTLEILTPKDRKSYRYRLPLDDGQSVAKLALAGETLVALVDGRPRVFRLDGLLPATP
jgi:hypothetical protein